MLKWLFQHCHAWVALAVKHGTVEKSNHPGTQVLLRCSRCGELTTQTVHGSWTIEDCQGQVAEQVTELRRILRLS